MMPPMMPLAGAGAGQGSDKTTKRDPVIFADRPLYEPADGVEQVFGAPPRIETDEPPFGAEQDSTPGR